MATSNVKEYGNAPFQDALITTNREKYLWPKLNRLIPLQVVTKYTYA
jgi:hypothetical protein